MINVIAASNSDRNLYLPTHLINIDIKVVIALNMFDEQETRGDSLNHKILDEMFAIQLVPCVASKGKGSDDLMQKVMEVHHENETLV